MYLLKSSLLLFVVIFGLLQLANLSKAGDQGEEISAAGRLDECCDEECYQEGCHIAYSRLADRCDIKIKGDHEQICNDHDLRDCLIFAGEAATGCESYCEGDQIASACDEGLDVSTETYCRQVRLDLKECAIKFEVEEEDEEENACGC